MNIAITGSTGGLGKEICLKLAWLGHNLILIDRNLEKSKKQAEEIVKNYPSVVITHIGCDLSNMQDVMRVTDELKNIDFDVLILNAGVYNVPLRKLSSGYNNVFQINFVSQYYMTRELMNIKPNLKFVAMGSVAHNYSKLDELDIDFSLRTKASKIYGNSKRFLMFSLFELFKDAPNRLCIAHPGVTLTNMTNHYPKGINWLVKIGLKLFFPNPKRASENVIYAVNNNCGYLEWIGPRVFNVWGKPKVSKLKTCDKIEFEKIAKIADEIYSNIKK